jgi:hypothetical protein
LTVFRVRAPFIINFKAPVIFLQHGLLSSAYCWISNYPHLSPAFFFALNGYDVWLGNNRGNFISRKHKDLDPDIDKKKYWDFSFVEMGKYDLSA